MEKDVAGLITWDGSKERKYLGKTVPFKDGVQLFSSKGKWWLYYGEQRITGSFSSKKAAMNFYNGGGR